MPPTPEELEDQAAQQAVRPMDVALVLLARELVAEINAATDPVAVLLRFADRLMAMRTPVPTRTLLSRARALQRMGARQAADDLGTGVPGLLLPTEVSEAIERLPAIMREELDRAAVLMRGGRTVDDAVTALAVARRAITRSEASTRWAVNRALSAGTSAVVEHEGIQRVWVPERDACLSCLAYAGTVAAAGQPFPGGLTYGTRPVGWSPVADPPLHPNCRCRIIVHRMEWGWDYPDALVREAQRSVLRGWSLPSESERARLGAADRLLAHTALPASVQDYAARSVRLGHFPRGRVFPDRPAITSR